VLINALFHKGNVLISVLLAAYTYAYICGKYYYYSITCAIVFIATAAGYAAMLQVLLSVATIVTVVVAVNTGLVFIVVRVIVVAPTGG